MDVQNARVRSRIRWIHEGETTSKFFFAAWKAKVAHESLTELNLEDGHTLTEWEEILKAVQENYSTLYTEDPEDERIAASRRAVLQLATTLRMGAYQRECCEWQLEDTLLLSKIQKLKGSPTLMRMLRSWKKAKAAVNWSAGETQLPRHLTLHQAVILKAWSSGRAYTVLNKAWKCLGKGGISTLVEGEAIHLERRTWLQHLRTVGTFPEEILGHQIQEIEGWVKGKRLVPIRLLETTGWEWRQEDQIFKCKCAGKVWLKHIRMRKNFHEELNRRWELSTPEDNWIARWKALWSGKLAYKKKIWLWKLLQRGYFTSSRAAEMGVSDGKCSRCERELETINHIFWGCRRVEARREALRNVGVIPGSCSSLIEWVDFSLTKLRTEVEYIVVLSNYIDRVWTERNHKVFRGQETRTPIQLLLQLSYRDIDVFPNNRTSERVLTMLVAAKVTIQGWKNTWTGRQDARHTRTEEDDRRENTRRQKSARGLGGADSLIASIAARSVRPTTNSSSLTVIVATPRRKTTTRQIRTHQHQGKES
ncbi:hypothetical protein R1sor_004893 [Riccia sorocarpa]|uniref:Reverse transcriptase zinc-binding domain-containing protein n=1 Tax=Riccia sorocarpa TaxID=122646 RepID=A0ABD3HLH7_9MARC